VNCESLLMESGGGTWTYWIGLVAGLASRCGFVSGMSLTSFKITYPTNDELLSLLCCLGCSPEPILPSAWHSSLLLLQLYVIAFLVRLLK
jgi:hypothetical protein